MNMTAYREVMRRKCRDSFWHFLLYGFGAYYNPKGKRWLDPMIHKPLCDWFQKHTLNWLEQRKDGKGEALSLMILVPRDVGKTTAITQAGLMWLHLQDPDLSTYIGSERTDFAMDIMSPLKSIMSGEDNHSRFAWLYGNWCDKQRAWSQSQVVHAARVNMSRKEPSFGTWGVESGITGKHPDVLCLDDPVSYEKLAAYSTWLQIVNDHMDSLVPVLPSDGLMILVGTRYHDGDHFGKAISKEGVISVEGMPMPGVTLDDQGRWHAYFLSARDIDGVPTIPSVWSEKRLTDYKKRNTLRYSAQVLNDPMNAESNPITRQQLENRLVDETQVPKNLRITFHLDTAFKSQEQGARGDWNAICKLGHSQDGSGTVYHLGSYGSNIWKGEDFGAELIRRVQEARRQGKRVSMITDEQLFGGKQDTWELLLETWFHAAGLVMPPFVALPRGGKKKVMRHVEAVNFILDDKVYFVKGAPGTERLFNELSKIGGSENDDFADAFSDGFNSKCYNVMHRTVGLLGHPEDSDPNVLDSKWDKYLRGEKMSAEDMWYDSIERFGGDIYRPIK